MSYSFHCTQMNKSIWINYATKEFLQSELRAWALYIILPLELIASGFRLTFWKFTCFDPNILLS